MYLVLIQEVCFAGLNRDGMHNNPAGQFLWYATFRKRNNIIDLLLGPILIVFICAEIEKKEDPYRECSKEKHGIRGGLSKKKPHFL